jgi:hypothetical protein
MKLSDIKKLFESEPKVHKFASTAEAYDASQTDDNIKDGDVLLTPTCVGFLDEAWPMLVKGVDPHKAFHKLKPGYSWDTVEGGKYKKSVELAMKQKIDEPASEA